VLIPESPVPDDIQRRGQSVLIVEDDADTRRALVLLLSQLGFDTVPVATVAESVERLDGQDRAILDLNLPDGVGTEVMQRIIDEKRPIRVMVTTGTVNAGLIIEASRLRAELILHKPINVNVLLRWLNDDAG
jgi:two-component system response regulator PilR (NtrC family)